ncbi:MAG: hypothetical protein H6839_15775 [Planctomycetes bacterium]|nr:hypothetical protein [Planctomycetota bacterium]
MRYLIPVLLAAFVTTGCATQQCTRQAAEPEQPGKPVPLLQDIPILGARFHKEEAKPTSAEVSDRVQLLEDIPILGRLFKRTESPKEIEGE